MSPFRPISTFFSIFFFARPAAREAPGTPRDQPRTPARARRSLGTRRRARARPRGGRSRRARARGRPRRRRRRRRRGQPADLRGLRGVSLPLPHAVARRRALRDGLSGLDACRVFVRRSRISAYGRGGALQPLMRAVGWVRRAAEIGLGDAMVALETLLQHGHGVNRVEKTPLACGPATRIPLRRPTAAARARPRDRAAAPALAGRRPGASDRRRTVPRCRGDAWGASRREKKNRKKVDIGRPIDRLRGSF